ncbi:MAG: hypothetical protein C4526_02075 [Nitrospiraceae bacterium]|nr:MAG: hypothetical protein C4526_02075 [Nitrospiraceae bacterium]
MSRRIVISISIVIFLIAVLLRVYGISRQSLWYDEVAEETAFKRQFLGDMSLSLPDTPPANAILVYAVSKLFPDSDYAIRFVPFIFGSLSVPLFFLLGKKLFNEKTGLISAFLLSISPFHIWYSQDARMYALFWMLILVSMLYFLRALDKPSPANYSGFIISSIAALYTLQMFVFIMFVQFLYLIIFFKKYKHQVLKWIAAFSVIVICYLPWIIHQLTSLKDRGTAYLKPVNYFIALPYTFYSFFAGFSIGPSLRELHINPSLTVVTPYISIIFPLFILYSTLVTLGLWSTRKDRAEFILLLLLIIMPISGAIVLTLLNPRLTYNVRYSGAALFGSLLCVSIGIDWLLCLKSVKLSKYLPLVAIAAIIGFCSFSYASYQSDVKYSKPDIRSAVSYIKSHRSADDVLLCVVDDVTFNRYSRSEDIVCESLKSAQTDNKKDIEGVLQEMAENKKRLWLILSREWYADKNGYAKAWLDSNHDEIKSLHKDITEIANVDIYCYNIMKTKDRIHSSGGK